MARRRNAARRDKDAAQRVSYLWDRTLGPRIGQQLNPVQTAFGSPTRGKSDSHLGEPRVHDVFAMTGTVEPALHDFLGGFWSVGNVLADQFLLIPGGADPVRR